MIKQTKKVLWKAIRAFCVECMGEQIKEVEICTAPNCPLFPYRLGQNHPSYKDGKKPRGAARNGFKNRLRDSRGWFKTV